jgi:DNA-binding transcriptional regulator LsrR (DeoR family)
MSENNSFSSLGPPTLERPDILATIAEMYYLRGLTQASIAKHFGVDRSTISRMLAEARQQNIVEIHIHHPLNNQSQLAAELVQKYGLIEAFVISEDAEISMTLLQRLGMAGALVLKSHLMPNQVLGLSWGTAVNSVIEAIQVEKRIPLKIVQLVGALGAHDDVYDGRGLVQRLAHKLGADSYYLNAPFLVENPQIARSLKENPSINEALRLGSQANLALMGIGSLQPEYSSFFQAGYVPLAELEKLRMAGMVGDVCGVHFTQDGSTPDVSFHRRTITIQPDTLKSIPVRIGVAGGLGKFIPIFGALQAGYINILVTDALVAQQLIAAPLERRSL